jgi:jumonji domain-containing protein 2
MEKKVIESLEKARLIGEPCENIFRHKDFILTREFLNENDINYQILTQNPGEFIVTFPRGYHFGFNTGLNMCEAVNYGNKEWIQFGKDGLQCTCSRNCTPPFDMSWFTDKQN